MGYGACKCVEHKRNMGSLISVLPQVYLDAWSFVSSAQGSDLGPASGAVAELVDNWTNKEFVVFVGELAELVNGYVTIPIFATMVRLCPLLTHVKFEHPAGLRCLGSSRRNLDPGD